MLAATGSQHTYRETVFDANITHNNGEKDE